MQKFLLPFFILSLASCSTFLTGAKQQIVVRSNINGAEVFLNGEKACETPCTLTVKKRKKAYPITLKAEGWKDVTGHKILITEHSQTGKDLFTIVGIYDKFHANTALDDDGRPTMMFYSDPYGSYINYFLLKFHDLTADNMQAVQQRLQQLYPDETIIVDSYTRQLNAWYDSVKHFRSAVMIAGICALLIALMGLIGYVNDEMQRRSKEIAIRKVNGATTMNVLRMMLGNVLLTAAPSAIAGAILAGIAAGKWLEDFSVKTSMSLWLFAVGIFAVLAVIASTVALNAYRTANSNPVKYLKNE